jgi:hypothetical protein
LPDDVLKQLAHTPPKINSGPASPEDEERAAAVMRAEAEAVGKQAAARQLDAADTRRAHVVHSLLVITVSSSSRGAYSPCLTAIAIGCAA